MEFDENYSIESLLSDDDTHVDEPYVEDEVVDSDPLGLNDISSNDDSSPEVKEDPSEEVDDKSSDFISSYLKEYGIDDPSKIKFENESGEIEEVDFNSLSDEDKLNIFKELSNPGYTDYEKEVINYLRTNNVTLDKLIEYYQEQAIESYLKDNPEARHEKTYQIDDYSDDELYLADLKTKFPDFTDEELTSKLDSAKLNEELFEKEVAAIRAQYKQQEEEYIAEQERLQEQSYQELEKNLQQSMNNFTEILLDHEDPKSDSIEIEDADRTDMMRYLLERDKDGKSQLVRDLEDPNALIEIAYYRTRERDNLTGLTRYWKQELANERKEKAKLQKELDKLKNKGNDSFVVTKPQKPSTKSDKKPRTVFDIYG